MFNAKWGIICGGVAFILAFITSLLLGHTRLLVALIRAGGFAALFFGLGAGIWALINVFVPELLNAQNDASGNIFSKESTGSRVNITLDDASDAALPGALPGAGIGAANDDEVGDFNDLVSQSINAVRDIDQNSATGYTDKREQEDFAPDFDASLGGLVETSLDDVKVDGQGNFSMDFGAFVSEGGKTANSDPFMDQLSFLPDSASPHESSSPSASPPRKSSSNKSAQLQGDFDPKEIAAGLRTVLEKDKKG
jgi:hypothetical protein